MTPTEFISIGLAAIAALFIWKGLHTGVTNWLLLLAGIVGGASLASQWLIPLIRRYPLQAGLVTLVIWALFYAEVIKKHDPHFIRTGAASLATGMSLVLCLGAVGQVISLAGHNTGPAVTSVTRQVNAGQG